jgi:plasmid stabilization system protein ParE
MPYLRLPDGSYMDVPEGVSQSEALSHAREKYKDLYTPAEKPDTGLTGAAKASYQTLKGDIAALAGRSGLMDVAEAQKYQKERQAEAQKVFKPTEEGWTEAPFLKARELLGGSLPYMAAPIAVGGAAALGGAPVAAGAGLAGLASGLQFTGSNLSRQMDTGKELKDTDLMAAGAAAIPQAALDVVGFKFLPGVQRIFKSVGKELSEEAAKKIVEAGTLKTAGQYALGGAKIGGIEGATEAGQQLFERLQAGLNIGDEQARKEYLDSFIGGAVLGGVASPFGVAGKRDEAKDVIAKEENKRQEAATAAEEARKQTPEYRMELESQRNNLQSRITQIQSVLKDPRLDKEAVDEAKKEIRDLQTQIKDVVGELKTAGAPAEEVSTFSIDQAIAEKKAQEEQEAAKNEQALKVKEDSQGFAKEHQALSSTVDYLQTKLQDAMKNGNIDQTETFGDLLDKKKAELDQLSDIAQRAGINVRTIDSQLKGANTSLRKAQNALTVASEDADLTTDKRKALIQSVKDAQATVEELSKQSAARKEEQAASTELAAKQQERLQGPTKWNKKTKQFEALSDEEIDQPIDMAEYELKANEMFNNRVAGLAAAATGRQQNFTNIDTAQKLATDIDQGKLFNDSAKLLELSTNAGKNGRWSFSDPKEAALLLKEVTAKLDEIEKDRTTAEQNKMDLPADPRLPYLEQIFEKLQETAAVEQGTLPKSKVETRRDYRYREAEIPAAQKLFKPELPIGEYTPKHIEKVRKQLDEINKMLDLDDKYEQQKVASVNLLKRQIKKAKATVDSKTASEVDKKAAKDVLARDEANITDVKGRQRLAKGVKERLERRKGRLENEILDATLPLRVKGKAPKYLRIQSDIETIENQLKVAKAPSEIKRLQNRLANANAKLVKVSKITGAGLLPKGGAKGERVVGAAKEGTALTEIQDAIDQLRKGEFMGGAAAGETNLEGQSRPLILRGIRNDVDTLIMAAISDINIGRRSRKEADMTIDEQKEFATVVEQMLLSKAARATGWRAKLQRAPETAIETSISQAFKEAGFDFGNKTAYEQYVDAIGKAGLTDADIVSNYGEANKQIEQIRNNLDTLIDKKNDLEDSIRTASDRSVISTYKKQIDRLAASIKEAQKDYEAAKADFVRGEKEGKGEIRTGMREEERVDIKDAIAKLKQSFGSERAQKVEAPEITAEKMADIDGEPKELSKLRNTANAFLESTRGILRGLGEALNIFTPVEVRKSKAVLDDFNKQKQTALDFMRDIAGGKEEKESFFNRVIEATKKEKEAASAEIEANAEITSSLKAGPLPRGETLINASLRRKADKLRKEADKMQAAIAADINSTIEQVKETIATAEGAAKQRLDADFKQFFDQLKSNSADYKEASRAYQEARDKYYTKKRAEAGAARAEEVGGDRERTAKVLKRGEQEGRQKVGLDLPGKKVEAVVTQTVLSNLAFANMGKKVTTMRKLFKAIDAAEGVEAVADAKDAYAKEVIKTRAYAEREGFGLGQGELGDLFIQLAKVESASPEGKAILKDIATIRRTAEEDAARMGVVRRAKKEVGPEGSIEREDKLKAIQAEQTEETKRAIERRKQKVTEKQRTKMRETVEKDLDKANAKEIKKVPDVATTAQRKAINAANDKIRIARQTLQAELDVITNADFDVLRNRGRIQKEAADRLYKKSPFESARDNELNRVLKKKDLIETKATGAKLKPADEKFLEKNGQELTEDEETLLKKADALGKDAAGYIEKTETKRKFDVASTAATLQKTKRQEAEDTYKKNLVKAASAKAQNVDFKTKLAFQNAKENVKEKILSKEFKRAVKELDAVREGYESVGITEAEFKKYVTKAEEQKLNAWENEIEDAKIDFDDFKGLHEGMQGDWDPRIEKPITGEGVSSSVAQRVVDKLKLFKGLKVLVIEKLTPTLRGAIAEGGYTDTEIDGVRGGVMPDGTVFIVSNNHADVKDVERTLAHEITGHLGVEGVLGQAGMDALAKKVISQNGSVSALADKLGVGEKALAAYMAAKQAGKSEEFAQAKALREVIAHTAEARPDKNFIQKANEFIKALVGAFRAALRKMGIDLDINTTDVYKLLRDARKSEKIAPGIYKGRDGEYQLRGGKATYGPGGAVIARGADLMMAKQAPLKDRLFPANIGLYLKQKLVAGSASLEKVLEVKGMKGSLAANQLKYYIAQHAQRFTIAGNALTIGVPVLRQEKGGKGHVLEAKPGANLKSLAETLGKIGWGNAEGIRNAYSLYRISKRANNVGVEKLNFKKPQEMAKMLKEVDALVAGNADLRRGFAEADKIYDQYNRDLMSFLVQTGALPKDKAIELVKNDDYVSFYRTEENGNVVLDLGGADRVRIGNLKDQPYLKELVGGDERIVDIYTGALQNTNMLIDMALHNLASRNVAFTLADLGLVDTVGDTDIKIRKGKGPASDKVIRFSVQPVDEKDDGYRHVMVNTDSTGIPSQYLVQGLAGVNTSVPSLVKSMGFFSRTLRSWVTRNPVYAARQIIRDPFTATMASGVDTIPVLTSLKAMGKSIGRMRRGEVGTSEIERLGLVSSNVFTGTSEDMQKILLQITSGKGGWESYLAKADALAAQGDASTREVAFNSFRKQGLSEMEAALATYETMPFTQRGTSSSLFLLSTMVPFLNAQIQGLNVLYNAFTGKATFQEKLRIKQKLWQRGMLMFGMSMAYALLMSEDEAYQNANDDERYNNWFVYVPGIDEPVRVPIPFELGIPFKALPEAIVNVMRGDRTAAEAVKALSKMVQNSVPLGPTSIPQAIKAPLEVIADYSFYTGRSIVGDRLAAVDPSERFNANTTELAKFIGKGTGSIPFLGEYLSPVQIEYMMRGYTGSLPLALASMTNPLFGSAAGEKPTARASEMPVVGSLFQPKDATGLVNRAYKDMETINRAGQTYDKLMEEGREKEADAYADRFADELSLAPLAGEFKQKMGRLAREEREIKSDPNLSGPEKRRQLDEIRQERIETAKELISERG